MTQLFEAIFCEGFYCQYRNQQLKAKQRPLPRGKKFLVEAARVVANQVRASELYAGKMSGDFDPDEHRRIDIVPR